MDPGKRTCVFTEPRAGCSMVGSRIRKTWFVGNGTGRGRRVGEVSVSEAGWGPVMQAL